MNNSAIKQQPDGASQSADGLKIRTDLRAGEKPPIILRQEPTINRPEANDKPGCIQIGGLELCLPDFD